MTNLEAYFRTYGIKIAQENFDKHVDFAPFPKLFPNIIEAEAGVVNTKELHESFGWIWGDIGIPKHLDGDDKK